MKNSDLVWQAEKNYYANVAGGIVGHRIYVEDAKGGELGYTRKDNIIYIAQNHPLFESLNDKEKKIIRLGITVHESLHQVFTDFLYYEANLKRLTDWKSFTNQFEQQIYHDLVNIVEDPAIESMASQVVGGSALKAINYTIAKIDELSGNFDTGCIYPFEEVINALIQFGDVGIIHGNFRFQTSKKIFKDLSPMFYEAINEPNPKHRIDLVYPMFQLMRRLWAGYSETKLSELSEHIKKAQSAHGNSRMNGSGSGSFGDMNPDSIRNKKRRATIRSVSKEEYKKALEEATSLKKCSGEDIEILYCEERIEDGVPKKEALKQNTQEPEIPKKGTVSKTDIALEKNENVLCTEEKENNDKLNEDSQDYDCMEDDILLQKEEIPELSMEDYKKIIDAIHQKNIEIEAQHAEIKNYYSDIPKYGGINLNNGFQNVSVINTYVSESNPLDELKYDQIVEQMSDGISITQEELKNIFYDDRMRKFYTASGRVNLKRIASGRVTTRLFEKKSSPGNKANMCIGIAGDHSNSMSGDKIIQEKLAVIALAEIFAEFGIPLYFMGFQVPSHTPVQTHYIRWENSRFERERLLYFKTSGCNFDSYSIRYMTHLLQERKEKHKSMFILSDGLPSYHFNHKEGIYQNILAIQDAREQKIDVIGIGIGDDLKTDTFVKMYGKDLFIPVKEPQDLFLKLSQIIITIVMGWG